MSTPRPAPHDSGLELNERGHWAQPAGDFDAASKRQDGAA